ncbi:MAG: hypothetical protein ACTSRU_00735 [Candidatus Hodarchaeales archaeon]
MHKDSLKIRNVLKDIYEEEICLEDVIMAFVACSKKMAPLEYKNSKNSFDEARKAFNKAKRTMQDFEARFKGPIKEDIILAISKVDPRIDVNRSEATGRFVKKRE